MMRIDLKNSHYWQAGRAVRRHFANRSYTDEVLPLIDLDVGIEADPEGVGAIELTPTEARVLAAELTRLADMIDGEARG